MSKEILRRLPLFANLDEADLDQLCAATEIVTAQAGDLLMTEGNPGDALYVVLDGEFEVTSRSGRQEVPIAHCGPGDLLGEIALLDGSPRTASVRALRASRLLMIRREAFQQVLAANRTLGLALLRSVTLRLRNTEAMLLQGAKMAALGTLAAGLAHELNNPAAAAFRSAAQARAALDAWLHTGITLQASGLDPAQRLALEAVRETISHTAQAAALDPLARSDREDEVQHWLEAHGVADAWEHAAVLVAAGWDRAELERQTAAFTPALAPLVARWAAQGLAVYGLLDAVAESTNRIATIVKAVKSYSYLDQAPVQAVDVHEGLETTLIILQHKLKAGIKVSKDYAPDLPPIEAHGSELNQVWTNIIDNAIDAMQGQGELGLRTERQGDRIVVTITDNGPGIPSAIQPRIFEPFFTTKPPGAGTGLGLHIALNIVVHRHRGQIQVVSQPGATCFRVILPMRGIP